MSDDREMTPAEIKAACEAQWNARPMQFEGARTVWTMGSAGLHAIAGTTCKTSMGATWSANMREMRAHYGPPAPSNAETGTPICPKWLRERFRRECPRNAAALIAGYGKTDSLAGKSREYIESLQRGPGLTGLMAAAIEHEAPPAPISAPAIDPAAMSDEALDAAAAPIFADVARELAEYVANIRADQEADAAREAAETAPEAAAPAPEPIAAPEAPKPASDRRRPRARRSRDMTPPTIWQARALGLVAAPSKKPRADARHAWSR